MAVHMCFFSVLLLLTGLPGALCDWSNLRTGGKGAGTVYGFGSNSDGSCSYGTNMADTAGLPWSTAPNDASDGGTGLDTTYIALNQEDLNGGAACGSCIWFRGTGSGIGVEEKKISTNWQYGVVDNVCPECSKGALDLARSYVVGNGIWTVEWHAVPCKVGDSKLYYSFPLSSPYFFNMVVSNGRVPVQSVTVEIDGADVELTRMSNNQWAYYNSDGFYEFPLKLKITPTCGDAVTDVAKSLSGGYGEAQFGLGGCPSEGNPVSGVSSPNDVGGYGTGSLSTESDSAARTLAKPKDTASKSKADSSDAIPPKKVSRKKSTSPKPSPKPTEKPSPKPSSKPSPKPTKLPSPAPTHNPTPKPSTKPRPNIRDPKQQPVSAAPASPKTPQELFGGVYSEKLKKVVLPPWYQCGNNNGQYPSTACGQEGYKCVRLTKFYMQCRNNDGSKSNNRRLLYSSAN